MYEIKIFKPCRRTVAIHDYYEDGTEAGSANTFTELTESARRQFYGTYQFQADAKKDFGKHSFELLAGTSRETYNEKILSGYRRDFLYDNYEVIDAGADNETKDNAGAEYEWLLVSAFGRFNYNYDQKYLFEANVRYDGTSRFIGKNRWAVFPSFSAGWVVSKENFFEGLRGTISQLKFRGSWGKLGNQNISSSYYPFSEPLSLGSTSMNGVVYQTIQQLIMSNPDLKWEETTMSGVGVHLSDNVPSPICPTILSPQAYILPSLSNTTAVFPPAAISIIPSNPTLTIVHIYEISCLFFFTYFWHFTNGIMWQQERSAATTASCIGYHRNSRRGRCILL